MNQGKKQKFRVGDWLKVKDSFTQGHVRTPHYVKGKVGVVERFCGFYPNPEELAYGRSGLPKKALYRIRFSQKCLWKGYTGSAQDTVDVEIYEHWLSFYHENNYVKSTIERTNG